MSGKQSRRGARPARHGVARVLSRMGLCSRSEAERWVAGGRVRVNGRIVCDAQFPVRDGEDRVEVDGRVAGPSRRQVLMLNKPRGLVTTARDEKGRATVYDCFAGAALPWLGPVGRLDKASEGLLLFTNDPAWAARVTDPEAGPGKTYHVQVDRLADAGLVAALLEGRVVEGQFLRASSARLLRSGERHAWLEILLHEGRNRQIRRLLAALDVGVLRLVRVAVGPLALGDLAKGRWRWLTDAEAEAISPRP